MTTKTTGPPRFELPPLPAATDGWGPSGPPASLEGGVPYAPFSKGERIGRIADFTPSAYKHGRYDRRDREPSVSVFNLAANEEDDAFHLVDNKPTQRSRGGGGGGGPGGGGGGGRGGGRFGQQSSRGATPGGAAGARARHERERGEPPSSLAGWGGGATAPRAKGNRWSLSSRGAGFSGNYNFGNTGASFSQSVVIRPDWTVLEQFQCSALAKLSHPQPSAEKGTAADLAFCGSLEHYDRAYDRLTPRTERPLRPTRRAFVASATASDDAKLKSFAAAAAEVSASSSNVKGTALITDSLLAVLMTAPRAIRGWDLVFTKKGNTLFVEKRKGSRADAPTVAESFVDAPPGDDPSLGIDSASSLSDEAAAAQRALSQQVLLDASSSSAAAAAGAAAVASAASAPPPKHECGDPPIEPVAEASTSGHSQQPRAGTAYRYRKFTLGGGASAYDMIVRCDVDAVLVDRGETKLVAVRALTEYDPKLTGVDWRAKLEAQRGAVLATELKNNAPKLARWAASALVSGVDLVKLGFVSRSHPRDASAHSVLGAHTVKPKELAANIALSPETCWGIAHAVIDLAMRLGDGKYLLVRESGKPVVRLYSVPVDAFDDEEDEEDEDGA